MKNRMPANCSGVWYSKPIFTPTNAVDQSQVAIIARKEVFFTKLFIPGKSAANV